MAPATITDCDWGGHKTCAEKILNPTYPEKGAFACGEMHKQHYNQTGYENADHWCRRAAEMIATIVKRRACECANRKDDENYNFVKDEVKELANAPDSCWYPACKPDSGQLIKSQLLEAQCPSITICNARLDIAKNKIGGDLKIENVNLVNNCGSTYTNTQSSDDDTDADSSTAQTSSDTPSSPSDKYTSHPGRWCGDADKKGGYTLQNSKISAAAQATRL